MSKPFRNCTPEPSPRYREIAQACREMAVNVRDDEFERIDQLSDILDSLISK